MTRFDISAAFEPATCLDGLISPACAATEIAGLRLPGQQADAQTAVAVTPNQAAALAVSQLTPAVPTIYSSAETDEQSGRVGTETFALVGMPVWFWSENLQGSTATATAGPFTVTAVAKLSSVKYEMGDGHAFACKPLSNGQIGTVYKDSFGIEQSPTCGYEGYQKTSRKQSSMKYTLTATATWNVTWTGATTGTTTLTTQDVGHLPVGEAQAIVTKVGF